jgi:CRISPR-associated protein Cas2
MAMTIVVTRNVAGRFRGFLASCMCEIAPGVYTAPRMTAGVRERIWTVLESWYEHDPDPERAVLMTWPDSALTGGQALRTLGLPRQELCDHGGVFLARRPIDEETRSRLTGSGDGSPPSDPLAS